MTAEWWETQPGEPAPPPPKKPRRWRDKFREAFRGVKLGVRGQSSFFVHFFFAALALTAALVLECNHVQWCLVVGCIGLVFTAELFNSAIETLFHALDRDTKDRMVGCLDITAGAVLVASFTAAIVGAVVFGYRVMVLCKSSG
jgi:diacylglycerol kinase